MTVKRRLRRISEVTKHESMENTLAKNYLLTTFIPITNTSEDFRIAMIELIQVYHGINHHHSYVSIDCGMKINSLLYCDSIIGKKVHCGRTKAEAIVENVLAPKSIELILDDLGIGNNAPIPFSIASDASNKGNHKLFPVAVKYFDINKGVQNKIIDFYEDNDESSAAISNSS